MRSTIFSIIRWGATALLAAALCGVAQGQNNPISIRLYFEQNSDESSDEYHKEKLRATIHEIELDSLASLQKIEIIGFCSPEGSTTRNRELAERRAEAVECYLTEQLGLSSTKITRLSKTLDWDELERLAQVQGLPEAEQLRAVILSGEPSHYVTENLYPLLRKSQINLYTSREAKEQFSLKEEPSGEIATPTTTILLVEELPEPIAQATTHPLLALKTNLLFDAATLINFEVEIPIGQRWSVAAEYIFPWWTMDNHKADSRRNRIQLLNLTLEGKRWWGERTERQILTGWFTGIYAGVGSYDFEHNAKGYQGEILISAGISGGYAHTINRAENLRLEYSLGIGYLGTDYKYYHSEFCNNSYWHAIEQRSGRYWWVGPTRARISLSWLINAKRRRQQLWQNF